MAASPQSSVGSSGVRRGSLTREIENLREWMRRSSDGGDVAAEALLKTAEHLAALVVDAPIVLWSVDTNGVLTRCEGAGLRFLGFESGVGRSVFELYADRPEATAIVRRALDGETLAEVVEVDEAAFDVWCTPQRDAEGRVVGVIGVATHISENRRKHDLLREIVEGTSQHTGVDFIRSLVAHLPSALGTRCAFACQITETDEQRLCVLSAWVDGMHDANVTYEAAGTPCEYTLNQGVAYFQSGLQQQFPDDDWIKNRKFDSYLGVAIRDRAGQSLGVLGALDDRPLADRPLAESILKLFADRVGAEIERQRAVDALLETQSRLQEQNQTLARLSRNEALGSGDLNGALGAITEAAAKTLNVARVNVWIYSDGATKIRCLDHFELATGHHRRGEELSASDYPAYFQALEEQRMIAATDARDDPRTREFKEGYLDPAGITSMLDAPVRLRGQMEGVICHEHVGPARVWTPEEQQFAAALADFAALALESHRRKTAEEALQQAHDTLEKSVEERTARLTATNRRLHEEIAGRRATEEKLRDSEARFRRLFAADLIGVFFANLSGEITEANDAFLRMVGYDREDLPLRWTRMTPPEWRERDRQAGREAEATGIATPWEKEYIRKDGTRVPILVGAAMLEGSQDKAIAFAVDLSERKHTEAALQKSEEKWRSLVDTAPDIILIVGLDGTIQYINRTVDDMQPEDVVGQSAFDFVAPEHRAIVKEHMDRVLATDEFCGYEVLGPGGGGIERWYTTRIGPYRQQGKVVGFTLIARDITEHRRAVQAVRESETNFRQLANTMAAATFIYQGPKLKYVNPAAATITGYSGDELLQMDFVEIIHPGFRGLVERRAAARLKGRDVPARYEVKIVRKDGANRWVDFTAADIEFEGRPAVLGTAFDVTDRKHAEEELISNQKFLQRLIETQERDRRMTAYEIHDGMVQDVTGALMHLETFRRHHALSPGEQRNEFDESLRLLRGMLDEARRLISGLRPPIIDEQGAVAAVEYLLRDQQVPPGIDVSLEREVAFGRLDPHLENAIFRIVQEALNNVYRHSQASRAVVRMRQLGDWLQLEIQDWGVGFDASTVAEHRFGLQGIRERARLFGGSARIESTPGEGTRVIVELPVIQAVHGEVDRSSA